MAKLWTKRNMLDFFYQPVPGDRPLAGAVVAAAGYSDRVCPTADTVARIQPHFAALGITRLARQTGLDDIGIPCFAAIRPNSRTLATNQGKGLDDNAAKASAVMEALEYAVAESPTRARRRASLAQLRSEGAAVHWPERLLPPGYAVDEHRELFWLAGRNYFTGAETWVPFDAVAIGQKAPELASISISTNGLASGNVEREAVFHALCELIERDACSLMAISPDDSLRHAQVRVEAFHDPMIDSLARRIHAAGCTLALFDVTTNLGVPCFEAVIFDDARGESRHFDLSAGAGCHPVAARAAIRAITEAAQTRITNIAGSRDDFKPNEYRFALDPSLAVYRGQDSEASDTLPPGCDLGTSLEGIEAWLGERLTRRGVTDIIVVPLGGEPYGASVVKVLAPRLEDKAPNANWRPGPRALSVMMRAT